MAHDDGVQHRVLLKGKLILAQLTQALVGGDADSARGWLQITPQNLHKGRFTTTIGADEAVTVAVTEFDGDVLKQGLGPELHSNVGCRDQGTIPMAIKKRPNRSAAGRWVERLKAIISYHCCPINTLQLPTPM